MIPVAIIGGGPAGLMAAEQLTHAGIAVALFDSMPSVGRKLLLAGIGGLNITHSEPTPSFLGRYAPSQARLAPVLAEFGANELRAWVHDLGIETFVGSSGRVFPKEMKAAPLLRRWLSRLRAQGLMVHSRHRCVGVSKGSGAGYELVFDTPDGQRRIQTHAVIFAMGGGSWARLGSDAAWQQWLAPLALTIQPLRPANGGFQCAHSDSVKALAGSPLKNIMLMLPWLADSRKPVRGEVIITEWGIEGSLIYAHSAMIRDRIEAVGYA
ncbi:MAG: TIGR03862 family flavoprotein, partial [Paraperlucidibaca sp.]